MDLPLLFKASESGRTSFRLIMPMATTEISNHD
jgi:hypothetical protein